MLSGQWMLWPSRSGASLWEHQQWGKAPTNELRTPNYCDIEKRIKIRVLYRSCYWCFYRATMPAHNAARRLRTNSKNEIHPV